MASCSTSPTRAASSTTGTAGCFGRIRSGAEPRSPAQRLLLVSFLLLAALSYISASQKEEAMPRQRSLVTVIRDMVQQEVRSAIHSLLGSISTGTKPKATNGRRRRRKARGNWRPGGPGRPPKAVAEKAAQKKKTVTSVVSKAKTVRRRRRRRRGPGRPPGSKTKAA